MQWQDIEKVMHTLKRPSGGFTVAHRGVVTMQDGTKLFIKIGVDRESRHWAQKEINVYLSLQRHGYPFIPQFLAHNEDKTGFALEALNAEDGWNWTETWNETRLAATLKAMEELAAIGLTTEEKQLLGEKGISAHADGWRVLVTSPSKQAMLREKLRENNHLALAENLDIQALASRSMEYQFNDDTLVHHDIRADNCAWYAQGQTVKLIDWSWAQMGDRIIDQNAMLAHVYRSGFNVLEKYRSYLEVRALEWLAGFWLNASTNPPHPVNPHVRRYQLASGVAALELAAKL